MQDGEVYRYHLGTPRELTSQQGKLVWKARYKTYGNVAEKDVEEVENNLRFQGQYFDEETGLHYNRHRYYDPTLGQFTTQDPIGLLGGVNNYQYAPNPVGWVDPLGLTCKEILDNYNILEDLYQPSRNTVQALHNKTINGRDIVFAGHGSINLEREFVVPEGTTLTVYAVDGAMISDRLSGAIERREEINPPYKKKFNPGDVIPEYVLYPNCGNLVLDPSTRQVTNATPISELLEPNMGDCHWAACSHVRGHDYENVLYDTGGIYYLDPTEGKITHVLESNEWKKV